MKPKLPKNFGKITSKQVAAWGKKFEAAKVKQTCSNCGELQADGITCLSDSQKYYPKCWIPIPVPHTLPDGRVTSVGRLTVMDVVKDVLKEAGCEQRLHDCEQCGLKNWLADCSWVHMKNAISLALYFLGKENGK